MDSCLSLGSRTSMESRASVGSITSMKSRTGLGLVRESIQVAFLPVIILLFGRTVLPDSLLATDPTPEAINRRLLSSSSGTF
jgi:hypothetical protein